jgi:beta-glucosidase
MKNTGRPMDANNKYTSKYLDESNDPLYPFGYGLSYTTFAYGDVILSARAITANDELKATCKVTNTGKLTGEETVQLYIHDLVGSVTRPVRELKGFKKITLQPGESKDITFTLHNGDLSFYRRDMTMGSEPGKFHVYISANARDGKPAEFLLK